MNEKTLQYAKRQLEQLRKPELSGRQHIEKKCSTCREYNGEEGDGIQFCDEREIYTHEDSFCCEWFRKRE